jgi:hypothetical protein
METLMQFALDNDLFKSSTLTLDDMRRNPGLFFNTPLRGSREETVYTDKDGEERTAHISFMAKVYGNGKSRFQVTCYFREDMIRQRDEGVPAEPCNEREILAQRGVSGTYLIVPTAVYMVSKKLCFGWRLACYYPSRENSGYSAQPDMAHI